MRLTLIRYAGGAAKPHWGEPPKNRWQPFIPDRMHYGEHPTYTNFVLWLRGLRNKIEYIGLSTWNATSFLASIIYNPIRNSYIKHNPDVRYDISQLLSLGIANDLNEHGFWNSKTEETNDRITLFNSNVKRLDKLWENALFDATEHNSFDIMCKYLKVDSNSVPTGIIPSTVWNFNMIPYGNDNPDTQVFTDPANDKPLRSVAINFTYNNQFGNWGDYINRQDNKGPLMRPARTLFTDVYIPTTK